MKTREDHEWVCTGCGCVKIHSIIHSNDQKGKTYCGICKKHVIVHKRITRWVVVDDVLDYIQKIKEMKVDAEDLIKELTPITETQKEKK